MLVVIRGNIHFALFLGRLLACLFRFQRIPRHRHDFTAQSADGFKFYRGGGFRRIDRHADAHQFARQRHRLAVITAGGGDHPALTLFVTQQPQFIAGAAKLE
ncbi:hypothetical protein D3C87_1812230 [compost metagenome]